MDAQGILNLLPLIAIFFIFYFMMLRPQQKKVKNQTKFIQELKKGDIVATSSGLIGKVNKIDEGIVSLQLDQKTFVKVTLDAISHSVTEGIKDKAITI